MQCVHAGTGAGTELRPDSAWGHPRPDTVKLRHRYSPGGMTVSTSKRAQEGHEVGSLLTGEADAETLIVEIDGCV